MRADHGRDIAVAIQPGERFGHQPESDRSRVILFCRGTGAGAVRAQIFEHVPRLPQSGGEKYSMEVSWQADLSLPVGIDQLWDSLARQRAEIGVKRAAALFEELDECDPPVGRMTDPLDKRFLLQGFHPTHRR